MEEESVWYEVRGTRCFPGQGYSDEDCLQTFETVEAARVHRYNAHAAPERTHIVKITEEEIPNETI